MLTCPPLEAQIPNSHTSVQACGAEFCKRELHPSLLSLLAQAWLDALVEPTPARLVVHLITDETCHVETLPFWRTQRRFWASVISLQFYLLSSFQDNLPKEASVVTRTRARTTTRTTTSTTVTKTMATPAA